MDFYQKAVELLDEDATEFYGGVSDEQIEQAMAEIGLPFPESYKTFLRDFGGGDTGGEIIFGITDVEEESVVEVTKMEHAYKMPKEMIVIHYWESDNCLCCLDTGRMENGECPVVKVPDDYKNITTIAESFGEFFYEMVKDE